MTANVDDAANIDDAADVDDGLLCGCCFDDGLLSAQESAFGHSNGLEASYEAPNSDALIQLDLRHIGRGFAVLLLPRHLLGGMCCSACCVASYRVVWCSVVVVLCCGVVLYSVVWCGAV